MSNFQAQARLRRRKQKAKKAAAQAAAGADPELLRGITPKYLEKLRVTCLRQAHEAMPGADPQAVTKAAEERLEAMLRLLRGQS
ncbi:MAG: hypothetical protein ACLPKT_01270 [Methylocella sp.]